MGTPAESVAELNEFMKSLKDTKTGFEGLVGKLSTMQLEATEKGFDSLAEALGKPFSTASQCIDQIKTALHDVELERNRIQNEQVG